MIAPFSSGTEFPKDRPEHMHFVHYATPIHKSSDSLTFIFSLYTDIFIFVLK